MAFTVAVDGPAAAGKGTIARAVAAHFDFAYLDTGLLYRAIGAKVLIGDDPVEAAKALSETDLADPYLRNPDVAIAASKVAAIPEVRASLFDFQVAFARRAGGAVLDGRDIGTVVCPEAEVKLYVTASETARAQRRYEELRLNGEDISFETVLSDLQERDKRDQSRSTSPLRPAQDAILMDTTDMSVATAISAALERIKVRYD